MSEQNNRPRKNPCPNWDELKSTQAWATFYQMREAGVPAEGPKVDAAVKHCAEIYRCIFSGEVTPAANMYVLECGPTPGVWGET
jgi:hypothetical protein